MKDLYRETGTIFRRSPLVSPQGEGFASRVRAVIADHARQLQGALERVKREGGRFTQGMAGYKQTRLPGGIVVKTWINTFGLVPTLMARVYYPAGKKTSSDSLEVMLFHGIWTAPQQGGLIYLPQPALQYLTAGVVIGDSAPIFLYKAKYGGAEDDTCTIEYAGEAPEIESSGLWVKPFSGREETESQAYELTDTRLYPGMFSGSLRALVQAKITKESEDFQGQWDFIYAPDPASLGLARDPESGVYWLIHVSATGVSASRLDSASPLACQEVQWRQWLAAGTVTEEAFNLFMAFIYLGLKTTGDTEFQNIAIGAGIGKAAHGAGYLRNGLHDGWNWNADGSKAVVVMHGAHTSTWDPDYQEFEFIMLELSLTFSGGIPSASIAEIKRGIWDGANVMVETPFGWGPFATGWLSRNPALDRGILRAWYDQKTGERLELGFFGDRPYTGLPGPTAFTNVYWCGPGAASQTRWDAVLLPIIWPENELGLLGKDKLTVSYHTTGGRRFVRTKSYGAGSTYYRSANAYAAYACAAANVNTYVTTYDSSFKQGLVGYITSAIHYLRSETITEYGGSLGTMLGLPADPESGVAIAKRVHPSSSSSIVDGAYDTTTATAQCMYMYGMADNVKLKRGTLTFGSNFLATSPTPNSWSESEASHEEFLGLQLYGRRGMFYSTLELNDDGTIPWNNWFYWDELEDFVSGPVIIQSAHNSIVFTPRFDELLDNCALSSEARQKSMVGWLGGV